MSVLLKLTLGWVAAKLMPALSHEKKFVAGYKDSGALYDPWRPNGIFTNRNSSPLEIYKFHVCPAEIDFSVGRGEIDARTEPPKKVCSRVQGFWSPV